MIQPAPVVQPVSTPAFTQTQPPWSTGLQTRRRFLEVRPILAELSFISLAESTRGCVQPHNWSSGQVVERASRKASEMDESDLKYEIKRLTQKNDVLERENRSLKEYLSIFSVQT